MNVAFAFKFGQRVRVIKTGAEGLVVGYYAGLSREIRVEVEYADPGTCIVRVEWFFERDVVDVEQE
jgi:hypothetical protein